MTDLSVAQLQQFQHRPLAFFWHHITRYPVRYALYVSAPIVGMAINGVFTYTFSRIIQRISDEGVAAIEHIWPMFFMALALWLSIDGVMNIAARVFTVKYPQIRANVRQQLFSYLQQQSLAFFQDQFSGRLGHQVNECSERISTMNDTIVWGFCIMASMYMTSIVLVFIASPVLGISLAAAVIGFVCLTYWISIKQSVLAGAYFSFRSHVSGRMVDALLT